MFSVSKLFVILVVCLTLIQITTSLNSQSVFSNWVILNNFPYSLASNTAEQLSDSIVSIGGSSTLGGSTNELHYSQFDLENKITSWSLGTNMPNRLIWHSSVSNKNNIYVLGGFLDNIDGISKTVTDVNYFIKGTNVWITTTPLPDPIALGSSIVIGNKIYFAGGNKLPNYNIDENTNQNIYFADINEDGSLGNWSIAGTLPEKLIGFGFYHRNGYVYVFGGKGENGISQLVKRISVNENGLITGDWQNLNPLPNPIWRFGYNSVQNFLVTAGGVSANDVILDNMFYAQFNSDGTISAWQEGPKLPYPNCCSPLAVYGDNLYLIGGHDGSSYTDRVLMTGIIDNSPSASPSPSPSISPFPTATPTTFPKTKKIVFIPGLGGSWNVKELLNCSTNPNSNWVLAPYARNVYKNILDNIPQNNAELIPFYYDWRKDIRQNALELKTLIKSIQSEESEIYIAGHSMGGLIARNYIETNNGGGVSKLIMIGTPNKGSSLAYPLYVNGEVWTTDLTQKIATTLLIKRCGIPESIQNLLPTYNYLRDRSTGNVADVNSNKLKNNYLPTDFSTPFWGVNVGTLSGTGVNTVNLINVSKSPQFPDGKPVGKIFSKNGDGTVLTNSVRIPDASVNEVVSDDHAGIIANRQGLEKIFEFLGLSNPKVKQYKPIKSAIVIIGSDNSFGVKDTKGNTYQSQDSVVTITEPTFENFKLSVLPSSNQKEFIFIYLLPNNKIIYKEFKFKGFDIKPKHFFFKDDNFLLPS